MTPIEVMAKAIRKEFVDRVVDHANPHWGTSNPDYLKITLQKAGYPKPDEAADFFADAAARAALLALSECELPKEVIAKGQWALVEDVIRVSAVFRNMLKAIASSPKPGDTAAPTGGEPA